MNTLEGSYTYSAPAFKYQLYSSAAERRKLFGYDYMSQSGLQNRHHDAYFQNTYCGPVGDISRAPDDYYYGSANRPMPTWGQNIGYLGTRPNLYNDNVNPWNPTFERPNMYRSWEPLSTTATPAMQGSYTQFLPYEQPCEVAPWNSSKLWVADINSKIYERAMVTGAEEQPYSNWYRRQGLAQLLNINNPERHDDYTVKLDMPENSFCAKLAQNKGVPPAVVNM